MRKNDKILAIAIILLAIVLAISFYIMSKQEGDLVIIELNGTEFDRILLHSNEEVTVRVEGEEGRFNVVLIHDGKVIISEANCPDKLCMGMGPLASPGRTIVCLPHRVVVYIKGEGDLDG